MSQVRQRQTGFIGPREFLLRALTKKLSTIAKFVSPAVLLSFVPTVTIQYGRRAPKETIIKKRQERRKYIAIFLTNACLQPLKILPLVSQLSKALTQSVLPGRRHSVPNSSETAHSYEITTVFLKPRERSFGHGPPKISSRNNSIHRLYSFYPKLRTTHVPINFHRPFQSSIQYRISTKQTDLIIPISRSTRTSRQSIAVECRIVLYVSIEYLQLQCLVLGPLC